jgi:hypothetical protein
MKFTSLLAICILFLGSTGCAREAFYADREHGIASSDAFDQLIVHKDYKYASKPVEGIDANYIENVMGRYLETFSEGFTKEQDFDINEANVFENDN